MRVLIVLLVVVVVGGCVSQRQAGNVTILASLEEVDSPAEVTIPGLGTVEVSVTEDDPPEVGDCWAGDNLLIRVRTKDGRDVAQHAFQSSYGLFRVDVLNMDADAEPEFVLLYGWGRGTSARSEKLSVYTLSNGEFHLRLSTPRSDSFGSCAQWQYDYSFRDTDGDGIVEVHMELSHTPIGEGGGELPELIPPDKRRVLVVKPDAGGRVPQRQAAVEPAPDGPALYFELAIPRHFQAEVGGWRGGTPGYERYIDGFTKGWWMCVGNYVKDIGYQSKRIDDIANGHGEFISGFSDGYWNAERQIQWSIKTFGPERTHAYLVEITANVMAE